MECSITGRVVLMWACGRQYSARSVDTDVWPMLVYGGLKLADATPTLCQHLSAAGFSTNEMLTQCWFDLYNVELFVSVTNGFSHFEISINVLLVLSSFCFI